MALPAEFSVELSKSGALTQQSQVKILLVEPPKAPASIGGEEVFLFEPLALEYLAAAVAGNHDVRILDLRLDSRFESVLGEVKPDVVGLTAYTSYTHCCPRICHCGISSGN